MKNQNFDKEIREAADALRRTMVVLHNSGISTTTCVAAMGVLLTTYFAERIETWDDGHAALEEFIDCLREGSNL